MDSFKIEFDRIEATYYDENPFIALVTQKEIYSKSPLILYGCGLVCRAIVSVFNEFDIKITAVCDSYKTGIYNNTGLEIISPEKLMQDYPDANIIICSYKFADEIKNKLITLGFPEQQICQSTHSAASYINHLDFVRDHLAGYEWAYNFFKDDISKKLVLDRIRMYFIGTKLSRTSDAPEYFDPEIIRLCPDEVFIDGGAYTGDTAEEFIRQTEIKKIGYRHIYSFEPDDAALKIATRNLEKYENIDVIDKGLWSCDTDLKFFSDGGNASSSFISGTRSTSVPVTSIDSYFANKFDNELPTFIKMDIEGAEKEALLGAKTVIMQKHPKLAICVYHKPEDIYELPRLIYDIDPSYQFTLRQCADGLYETILYAV